MDVPLRTLFARIEVESTKRGYRLGEESTVMEDNTDQ